MAKTIEFELMFNNSAEDVYNALMQEEEHSEFTGGPAKLENKENGSFSLFGGAIQGISTVLKPHKKIEQDWRAGNWEEGYYSKVTWTLEKSDEGTVLKFKQTGVPDDHYDQINEGWEVNYIAKLPKYLES